MRLIDAEPVLGCIKKLLSCGKDLDDTGKLVSAFKVGLNSVKEIVEVAPTIDAVPVVRCKDCKWFNTTGYEEANEDKESGLEFGHCRAWNRETQACVFCSHGERREENADN